MEAYMLFTPHMLLEMRYGNIGEWPCLYWFPTLFFQLAAAEAGWTVLGNTAYVRHLPFLLGDPDSGEKEELI